MPPVIENTLLHTRLQPTDPRDSAVLLNPCANAGAWWSLQCDPGNLMSQIQHQISERRKRGQSLAGMDCEIRLRTEINSGHPRAKVVIPLDQLSGGKLRAEMRELWKNFGGRIREVCSTRGITLSEPEEVFVRQFENPPRRRRTALRTRRGSLRRKSAQSGHTATRSSASRRPPLRSCPSMS